MKSHDFSGLPAGFSRRHFLGASLGAITALALGGLSRPVGAASPIVLPPLPYADSALAPVISANTIGYHYGKHHKAYVDNLNKFIAGTDLADLSLDKIVLATAGKADKTAIFNNSREREHILLNRLREYTKVKVPRSYFAELDPGQFERPAMIIERIIGCTEPSVSPSSTEHRPMVRAEGISG